MTMIRVNSKARAVAALALATLCGASFAQDTNYWTQQYGTRSNLLGGAVIGSATDMSATYYNPGAIALFEEASFLLSAKVYEYSTLKVEGGANESRALTTSSITPTPDLLAGSLNFHWLGKHKLSYSLLTRQQLETDLRSVRQSTLALRIILPFAIRTGGRKFSRRRSPRRMRSLLPFLSISTNT